MNEYKNIIDNINNNNLDDAEKICRQTNNFENNHLIQNFLGIINAKKNKFDSAEKNFIKSFYIFGAGKVGRTLDLLVGNETLYH